MHSAEKFPSKRERIRVLPQNCRMTWNVLWNVKWLAITKRVNYTMCTFDNMLLKILSIVLTFPWMLV